MVKEERKTGLSSKIAGSVIDNLMDMKKKGKKNKNPLNKIKLSKTQINRNYAVAIIINENRSLNIKKVRIEDESFYLPETRGHYMGSADYIYSYKKFPVLITPSWSVKPINVSDLAKESREDGTNIAAEKFIIMKSEMIAAGLKPHKAAGGKLFIYLIIGIIVLYLVYSMITGQKIF